MPGLESKLPDGWERSETNSGIPYYIDHETESTSWDHPEMVKLLQEIASLNNIKYAAYRTAMKLRAIQKKTQMFLLELPVIVTTLQEQDIRDSYSEKTITASEVHRVITAIYINQNGDRKGFIDVPLATDLTFNWMLNTFDQNRTGFLRTTSLKIGLSLMCAAKIQDKYKYIFRQLCSSKGWMDRKRLKGFLQDSLQIPRTIYESSVFSGTSVEPAVRNCFERTGAVMDQLNLEEFLDWMVAEPQTIVWLPTLHRVAVSETVKHEAKCNICKMCPIVGFRYRCLKCFNFDLCQECFWLGRTNKAHKVSHPTQEYCLAPSQKEDIKDFAKVMRNKVSKKKKPRDPSKGRYISITNEDAAPSSDEEYSVDGPPVSNAATHGQLGSFAAKLADYDDRKPIDESPRSVNDRDERSFHSYPRQRSRDALTTDLETSLPLHSPADLPSSLDIQQKDELENLISNLEDDNRALRDEIDHIRQLQLQNLSLDSNQSSEEAARLRQRKERLLAREEVLESHNQQLEIQLSRLRSLLHQNLSRVQKRRHEALSPTIPYQPTPLPATTRLDGLYLNKQSTQPLQQQIDRQPSTAVYNISHDRIQGLSSSHDNSKTRDYTAPSVRDNMPSHNHSHQGHTPYYDSRLEGAYSPTHDHNGYTPPEDGNQVYTSQDGIRIVGFSQPNDINGMTGNIPSTRSFSTSPGHSNEGRNMPQGSRVGGYSPPQNKNGMEGSVPYTTGFSASPDYSTQGLYTQLDGNRVGGYSPPQNKNGMEGSVPYTTGFSASPDYSTQGLYTQLDSNRVEGYSPPQTFGGVRGNGMSPVGYSHNQGSVLSSSQEYGRGKQSKLQSIVERMVSSFPITEPDSDISMEIHSDLFRAASMVGEAMQSLVTAVSRQGVPSSAFPE